jgi:uncharacterized alkaline shock family protein YloU
VLAAVQGAVEEQVSYQTALNVVAVDVVARRLMLDPRPPGDTVGGMA